MAPLPNQRNERFACLLAEGRSAREAYVLAGYRDNRHNAARLKANETVEARVRELQMAGAKSAEVSVASLLAELEEARSKATDLKQLSAAVRATSEKAKISGLLTQKVEMTVSQDTGYENAVSIEEIMEKVIADFGFGPAEALMKAFGLQICEDGEIIDINRSTPKSIGNIRHLMGNARSADNARPVLEWTPPRKPPKREI